jgi:hypothetical protein
VRPAEEVETLQHPDIIPDRGIISIGHFAVPGFYLIPAFEYNVIPTAEYGQMITLFFYAFGREDEDPVDFI